MRSKERIAGLFVLFFLAQRILVFGGSTDDVNSLFDQWAKARQAHSTAINSPRTTADIDLDYGSRLLELAKKFDTNSDVYAQALIFAIDVDTDGAAGDQASELLARDCINNKRLENFFNSGPHPKDAAAENLFQTIAQKSAIRAYRGQATKILADLFKDSKPEEAEKLYEQVIEKYADVKSFEDSRQKLGPQAQGGLFYVQNLAVGKVAPDFSGEDVNGATIKLSDYRNKVVVICFCSESCAPCRQLYPYWRSLEERMKGKPFALIGINPDSKAELLKAAQREKFTWPVLWDHGDADTLLRVIP
jgi:thiol-disulfide isomerase/thioredoxin